MTTFKNDMTMMFVMHDALRRDLDRIARLTARTDDDPKHILRTAAGWEMFKSYLHAHHTSEDELLWPPLRKALPDDAHGTALLDAMEAEHAAIDPLIDGFDAALADRNSGPARLGELADALASGLRAHLTHEEKRACPSSTRSSPRSSGRRSAPEAPSRSQATSPGSCRGCSTARPRRSLRRCSP